MLPNIEDCRYGRSWRGSLLLSVQFRFWWVSLHGAVCSGSLTSADNGIFTAIENCRADSLGDGHGLIHHVSHLAPRSGLGQASGIIIGTALGAALFFCIFGTCLCLCFNHIKRSKEERREERARDLAAVTSFPVPGSMVTPLEAAQTAPQQYIRKEDAAARAEAQIPRHPARFPEPYAEVRGYYEAANSSSTRQEPRGIELQAVQQLPRLA